MRLLPSLFANVPDNLIGDAGATSLARVLVNVTSLKKINFAGIRAIKRQ